LLLLNAIERTGSIDQAEHGPQIGHEMVIGQWQKKGDKLANEVIWPKAAKTAEGFRRISS
jgi:hypothetical protein